MEEFTKIVLKKVAKRYDPELKNEVRKITKEWRRICRLKNIKTISLSDLRIMIELSHPMRGKKYGVETALQPAFLTDLGTKKKVSNPMRGQQSVVETALHPAFLTDLRTMKKVSYPWCRQQPVVETALQLAIRTEVEMLSKPQKYPQAKAPLKHHLLAWLVLNPTFKVATNNHPIKERREVERASPCSSFWAREGEPTHPEHEVVYMVSESLLFSMQGGEPPHPDQVDPSDGKFPTEVKSVRINRATFKETASAASEALGLVVTAKDIEKLN
jgi:hypothetical protein